MKLKFLKSADGTRLIRLRDIRSANLQIVDSNGFVAARITAQMRNGADPVILAGYAAISDSTEGRNLPLRAQSDMDRLLSILNGGRLQKGEIWPSAEGGAE